MTSFRNFCRLMLCLVCLAMGQSSQAQTGSGQVASADATDYAIKPPKPVPALIGMRGFSATDVSQFQYEVLPPLGNMRIGELLQLMGWNLAPVKVSEHVLQTGEEKLRLPDVERTLAEAEAAMLVAENAHTEAVAAKQTAASTLNDTHAAQNVAQALADQLERDRSAIAAEVAALETQVGNETDEARKAELTTRLQAARDRLQAKVTEKTNAEEALRLAQAAYLTATTARDSAHATLQAAYLALKTAYADWEKAVAVHVRVLQANQIELAKVMTPPVSYAFQPMRRGEAAALHRVAVHILNEGERIVLRGLPADTRQVKELASALISKTTQTLPDPYFHGFPTGASSFAFEEIPLFYNNDVGLIMQMLSSKAIYVDPIAYKRTLLEGTLDTLLEAQLNVSQLRFDVDALEEEVARLKDLERLLRREASDSGSRLNVLNGVLSKRTDEKKAIEKALADNQTALTSETDAGKKAALEAERSRLLDADTRALAQQQQAQEDVRAQESRKAQLDSQLATAEADKQSLPAQILAAQERLTKAAEAERTATRNAAIMAQREFNAFIQLRENEPFWFAPAIQQEANLDDPLQHLILFGLPHRNTIVARGPAADLDILREAIRDLDEPVPQARLAVWSMQLTSAGDTKGIERLNKGLLEMDAEFAHTRSEIDAAQSILIDAIGRYVGHMADLAREEYTQHAAWRAWFEPESDAVVPRTRLKIAPDMELWYRYQFYEPGVLDAFLMPSITFAEYHGGTVRSRLSVSALGGSSGHLSFQRNQARLTMFGEELPAGSQKLSLIENSSEAESSSDTDERSDARTLAARDLIPTAMHAGGMVLPDPAETTTLGQAMLVLTLARREIRTAILLEFDARLYDHQQRAYDPRAARHDRSNRYTPFTQFMTALGASEIAQQWTPDPGDYKPEAWLVQDPLIEKALAVIRAADPQKPLLLRRLLHDSQPRLSTYQKEVLGALQRDAVDTALRVLATQTSQFQQHDAAKRKAKLKLPEKQSDQQSNQQSGQQPGRLPVDAGQDILVAETLKFFLFQTTGLSYADWLMLGRDYLTPDKLGYVLKVDSLESNMQAKYLLAALIAYRSDEHHAADVATADEMLKRLHIAFEDDIDHWFIQPMLDRLRNRLAKLDINVGILQRTTMLASNRKLARVLPRASADMALGEEEDALAATRQLMLLASAVSGGTQAAAVVDLLSTFQQQEEDAAVKAPDFDIYGINTGSVFQVTPVFDPSGQALRFTFDYSLANRVLNPANARDPRLPEIEMHTINTEVQLSNMELREVSRFSTNAKLGLTERKSGGIPILKDFPILDDLPLIGWFKRRKGEAPAVLESVVFAQTTMYPTIGDIIRVMTAPAPFSDASLPTLRSLAEEPKAAPPAPPAVINTWRKGWITAYHPTNAPGKCQCQLQGYAKSWLMTLDTGHKESFWFSMDPASSDRPEMDPPLKYLLDRIHRTSPIHYDTSKHSLQEILKLAVEVEFELGEPRDPKDPTKGRRLKSLRLRSEPMAKSP